MVPAEVWYIVCTIASKSTEIVCPRGDHQSVMVVTRKYHDPTHKPSPILPDASMQKGGGAYLQDSTVLES